MNGIMNGYDVTVSRCRSFTVGRKHGSSWPNGRRTGMWHATSKSRQNLVCSIKSFNSEFCDCCVFLHFESYSWIQDKKGTSVRDKAEDGFYSHYFASCKRREIQHLLHLHVATRCASDAFLGLISTWLMRRFHFL